jgi:hypothetical protein
MSRAREVSKIVETVENFDAVEYSSTPPANPQAGALWVDTSTVNPLIKAYNGDDWDTLGSAPVPIITGIAPSNISGSASTAIIVNGTNFESGSIVKLVDINNTELFTLSTTFNNSQSLQFLTPALTASAGPYDIKVTNTDNQFSIFENSLGVGSAPIWQTGTGLLGSIFNVERGNKTFSLLANDIENNPITYSIVSGSLPTGMNISSGGTISGTSNQVSSDTTYSFTVRATDSTGLYSDRDFSIITKSPIVSIFNTVGNSTWNVPSGLSKVEYLIVAGGGGGGEAPSNTTYNYEGGGGGGGVLYGNYESLTSSSYTITVGAGGQKRNNGSNSSAFNLVSIGGGYGGEGSPTSGAYRKGGDGGSGGGGANSAPWTGPAEGGSGIVGQGNSGGTGFIGGSAAGNGGGGAGGPGQVTPSGNAAATGGAGYTSSISGSNVEYGKGGYAINSGGLGELLSGTNGTGNGGSSRSAGGSGVVILRY